MKLNLQIEHADGALRMYNGKTIILSLEAGGKYKLVSRKHTHDGKYLYFKRDATKKCLTATTQYKMFRGGYFEACFTKTKYVAKLYKNGFLVGNMNAKIIR